MKALLVSINSIYELTGGGLYLRCLHSEISSNYSSVDILCKKCVDKKQAFFLSSSNINFVDKTKLADVISRFILSPSFLMFYFIRIFFISKDYDAIHFHSSRNALLAIIFKLITRKKVVIHFDNVEYSLSRSLMKDGMFILRAFDAFIMYFYEKFAIKALGIKSSFITINDKRLLGYIDADIHPIKVSSSMKEFPFKWLEKRSCSRHRGIFVASFSHYPNVLAFENLKLVAKSMPDTQFVVAGRGAEFLLNDLSNIEIYSDVSSELLMELYCSSTFCLALVNEGSGMKTKVAESMSYNLPVIASKHALIGYDEVVNNQLVYLVNELDDISNAILDIHRIYLNQNAYKIFFKYWQSFLDNYHIK
ncbi:glycosyltransferase [Aliivibrio fischeri]|uniref:glycosyltransferase n=1 Tax=Aliivibrio fischeri TaxID=668 RepID=UPI001F1D84AE|nr:glycosyltransferase [Aliivibrio fischeri]MCE7536799.1 glycosyltransferase [Aliivibrio fischeri]MCE7560485.1 glycosyltransferase [Aliivibrio fischeri]